jgi:hypothetical protein
VILMGNVSEKKNLNLSSFDLALHSKYIEGFNLIKYMCECLTKEKRAEFIKLIRDDFDKHPHSGDIFRTTSKAETKVFKLEEI